MKKLNLEGERFGRWLALSESDKERHWNCLCDCGVQKDVFTGNLISGKSRSCGCLSKESASARCTKHGKNKTTEHNAWVSMRNRTKGQGSNGHYYKERGIQVCERWMDKEEGFTNFLEDMGECPEGMTLDRIDNRLGYYKDNCKWSDKSQQASNRRKPSVNKSGRIGVYWRKDQRKWRVSITVSKVSHNLGQYEDYEEACRVCGEAELRLLGYSRGGY